MTDSIGISAISSYLPQAVLGNDEIVARFGFEPAFLEGKLGINERHIAAEGEAVSDMAISAATRLFESTGVPAESIDMLLVCTQNPDYRLPTTANLVQHRLGLHSGIAAFDINQGCSGFVYGLAAAKGMMLANGFKSALVITSEAYSKVTDPANRETVPLFGDGAAATLLTHIPRGGIGRFAFGSDGSGADDLIVRGGGSRNPTMPVSGEGALRMNGRAVFNFMMTRVPESVKTCLTANNLTLADIDLFVFHQASKFMLESLIKRIGLPAEKVPIMLADTGNTVSSTIPIIIEKLGGPAGLKGKRLLLCGFGVGLSWASVIVTFPE